MIKKSFLVAHCICLYFSACFGVFASSNDLYLEAENALINNNYSQSLKLIDQYLKSTSISSNTNLDELAKAFNLKGVLLAQAGKNSQALSYFQKALSVANSFYSENSPELHLAKFNLASTYCSLNRTDQCFASLSSIIDSNLDVNTRIRYYLLFGDAAEENENYLSAVLSYLKATYILNIVDPIRSEPIFANAYEAATKLFLYTQEKDIETLTDFSRQVESDPATREAVRFIIAKGQLILGQRDSAKSNIQEFLERADGHPYRDSAEKLMNQFSRLSRFEKNKIGVLLPLSGKYAKYGRLCLNSISIALRDKLATSNFPEKNNIELIIRDSGESDKSAERAFSDLVFNAQVSAVIGPLLRKQALVVGQMAQELGVPLFSLSQRNEMNRIGSYIFSIGLTPAQQIKRLVQFATKKKNHRRFAILAPSNAAGDEFVNLIWDIVQQEGGKITGLERYPPNATDFRDEVKKLVGLYYIDARKREIEELNHRKDLYAGTLRARGKLRSRLLQAYNPKALIDFDAIFIPDKPSTIGQIAPTFALHGADHLNYLGLNTWNTQDIIRRAGKYLQNAVFVDAFYQGANNPEVENFTEVFSYDFSSTPGTLEAQAYDAASILLTAITRNSIESRADIRNSVLNLQRYEGITSPFEFTDSGIDRTPYLLRINADKIIPVSN